MTYLISYRNPNPHVIRKCKATFVASTSKMPSGHLTIGSDLRVAGNKKSIFKRFVNFWNLCFPSENELKERYLSEATDLVDLEHRMKQWEQRSRRQNENGVIY